jgi:hypothetical protein
MPARPQPSPKLRHPRSPRLSFDDVLSTNRNTNARTRARRARVEAISAGKARSVSRPEPDAGHDVQLTRRQFFTPVDDQRTSHAEPSRRRARAPEQLDVTRRAVQLRRAASAMEARSCVGSMASIT